LLIGIVVPVKSPAELSEVFRAQGRKVTPQRLAVYAALQGDEGHPTAEVIYERVRATQPSISLRTVYQTLHDLAAMGEILEIDLGTGASRFDPNLGDHHHLVCEGCGRVHDVAGDHTTTTLSPRDAHGFALSRTDIVFRGLCPVCRAVSEHG
jgi:Fe2+ or Zn2+ uptake regulation protein